MKQMLKNYSLGALACIVLGVALLINPQIITDVLSVAIGVIMIVWAAVGIIGFIASRSSDSRGGVSVFSLIGHIIMIGIGIFILTNPGFILYTLMLTLGVYLLFSGITKLTAAINIRRQTADNGWKLPLVTAAATTLLGIVMCISPTFISDSIMRLIGIILVVAGASNFISGASVSSVVKKTSRGSKTTADGKKIIDVKDYKDD